MTDNFVLWTMYVQDKKNTVVYKRFVGDSKAKGVCGLQQETGKGSAKSHSDYDTVANLSKF